jgi:hypothetical protein
MKINGTPNNSFQNKVLLDTFVEQISALQEDVAQLQDADRVLDNKISQQLSEEEFNDFQADAHVSNLHATELNADTGFIGHLNSNQADVENLEVNTHAEIQDLTALTANIPSLITDDVTVQGNISSAGDITAKDAELENVSADKIETPLVEADLVKADVEAKDVETDTATIKDKLTVKDVEVSGTVTGLSEINANSVNANEAEIETINTENIRSWISQVMNQEKALLPTPQLGNIDRYTIELPRFNGVYLLSWEDQDIVWSATVIGNGKSYGISWGSRTDENFITDLFQYNGKLYIRVRSNGRLKFAYSATKELPQPVIYYNMVGWTSDKSLEELCDEKSHLINAYPIGMIWFGKVFIPKLETAEGGIGGNGINFKGSCTLAELPPFTDTEVGDVWNITSETYTDNRFVEGPGKPINAGDDVVAVEDSNFEGGADFEQINTPYSIDTISIGDYNNVEVHAINGNKILIQAGAYSTDGGQTWISKNYNNPDGDNILVLSNGKILWNSDHSVYLSEDNGLTFNYIFEESTGPIIELPNGKVYGFYENRMTDFGTKDNIVNGDFVEIIPDNKYIWKATVINNAAFIETSSNEIYISTDNCETWTLYSGTVDFSKSFISYYDESEVTVKTDWVIRKVVQFNNSYYVERWMDWYGGRNYYKTTDFENFYLIYSGYADDPKNLPYISFTKNNITGISYGIDSNGNLFTSTDDGNTWTETTPYNVAYGFIYCDSTGTLWAGSTLRKSTDGGQTWQDIRLTAGRQPTIASVIEAPNGNLIAATDGRDRWISTDRGQTWERYWQDGYSILNSYIIDGKVWATSKWYDNENKTGIITSEDGIEWTVIDSQDININTNFLQLVIDENGYIYYANRFSKDRGETWENINGPILVSLFNFERKIVGVDSHFDFNTPYSLLYQSVPSITKTLKWDKFSAGVNYDNFAATNITASTALKSEGTLEVDGTSQFDDDVTVNADLNADKVITPDLEVTGAMTANSTGIIFDKNILHTGDYAQTGNQNITGNETVSGRSTLNNVTANTVIIGDLD